MKLVYLFSVFYLFVSFLLYKKVDQKISIVSSIIYAVCLFFCYNTVVVCFYSFFKVNGSLGILSLFNYVVGTLLNFVSIMRKEIQKYKFNRLELIVVLSLFAITFLVGYFRFRGFNTISYETGDPAIHYRSALHFSRELEILNANNSKDIVYQSFERFMPISYINGGLLLNIFSQFKSYHLFTFYDVLCYILSSLLFLVTIMKSFSDKKKHYFYSFMITLLYVLAFPLNNLVFGFSYLGLGVMVVNLLYLTVNCFYQQLKKDKIFKVLILFMINFSLFFSYYLFIPCIYLALGLYYIYLWKKKNITIKSLFLYGIVTLIVPFLIGFCYFMLPGFVQTDSVNIFQAVSFDGYIYNNVTPLYLFGVILVVLILRKFKYYKREKITYFDVSFYTVIGYVLIFFILYILEIVSLYYFYKLFYLYWFFVIIFLGNLLLKYKKYIYFMFVLILLGMGVVYTNYSSKFANFLATINIYNWNAIMFVDTKIDFNKKELELMEESLSYRDICEYKGEFLIYGYKMKNMWYYSFTGMVPVFNYCYEEITQLYETNIGLKFWENLIDYDCLVYFYEDDKLDYENDPVEILYQNEEGAILKKNRR